MRIDWLLYHVASGHACFTGLALIGAAIVLSIVSERQRRRAVAGTLFAGTILVAISATPFPWFVYVAGVAVLVAWGLAESRRDRWPRRRLVAARAVAIAVPILLAVLESPYHVAPRLAPQSSSGFAVIGDSVTAGIGENEAVTWPTLLADRHAIDVQNLSQMGATVESAMKQAAQLRPEETLVVLEIGGNDLFGDRSAAEFATGLEALLKQVQQPGRTVVMFELPLPPGFNGYGQAQRRLADRYNVILIPKRVLMGVLTARGGTLDTIHLSQTGHDRLAEATWSVIGPAFGS